MMRRLPPSTHPVVDWLIALAAIAAITCAVLLFFGVYNSLKAQTNPNCTEFGVEIPMACCCTNSCCVEAPASEFENLGGDQYRSTVTGQIIKRTGWSAGGYVKCACDYIDGKWTKHPKANIRCLWVPFPSS